MASATIAAWVGRIRTVAVRVGTALAPSEVDVAFHAWREERFVARALALTYTRLALLAVGLGVLSIPAWSRVAGIRAPFVAWAWYGVMVAYAAANHLCVHRKRLGPIVTTVTLHLDLLTVLYVIVWSGGLRSPFLATQLAFTVLFISLFPRPLSIAPPLLALLITAHVDLLLPGRSATPAVDAFFVIWTAVLHGAIGCVIVYLNGREEAQQREIFRLQRVERDLARTEERVRLARELHDGLGGSLTALAMQADDLLAHVHTAEGHAAISEFRAEITESLEELRRSVHMLHEDFDLAQAIRDHAEKCSARMGMPITVAVSGMAVALPRTVQHCAFRLLQESLTNVAKHAHAHAVRVMVGFGGTTDAPTFVMTISDDGRGFDPTSIPHGHYGVASMRTRADGIGGTLILDTAPGKGACIRFAWPMM